jgi:hypothetical protein
MAGFICCAGLSVGLRGTVGVVMGCLGSQVVVVELQRTSSSSSLAAPELLPPLIVDLKAPCICHKCADGQQLRLVSLKMFQPHCSCACYRRNLRSTTTAVTSSRSAGLRYRPYLPAVQQHARREQACNVGLVKHQPIWRRPCAWYHAAHGPVCTSLPSQQQAISNRLLSVAFL